MLPVIMPKEKIRYAKNLTDKQTRRIFFLPNLSENSPRIDVEKTVPEEKLLLVVQGEYSPGLYQEFWAKDNMKKQDLPEAKGLLELKFRSQACPEIR